MKIKKGRIKEHYLKIWVTPRYTLSNQPDIKAEGFGQEGFCTVFCLYKILYA